MATAASKTSRGNIASTSSGDGMSGFHIPRIVAAARRPHLRPRRPDRAGGASTLAADMDERDRLRFAFLQLLYDPGGGRRRGSSNMWSIGAELGLDRREASAVFEYLKDAGLTEYRAAGGAIGLTYEGV